MEQQQTQTKQKMNFSAYFTAKVAPAAKKIEEYRNRIVTISAIWTTVVVILSLSPVGSAVINTKNPVLGDSLALGLFYIAGPVIIFALLPVLTAKNIYHIFAKEILIPRLLGFWGKFTYTPPANIFAALYKVIKNKSGINGFFIELRGQKNSTISINPTILARLLEFSNVTYDDKITGKHADVDIELTELETYYTVKTRNREGQTKYRKSTTFKGVVFSAKMNKNFNGLTVLSYNNIDKHRAQYPKVSKGNISTMDLSDVLSLGRQVADMVDTIKNNTEGKSAGEVVMEAKDRAIAREQEKQQRKKEPLQDVMLEDPAFNQKFKMCSTDQIEARYIFTTAFTERFMKIAESFDYRIKAIFIDNNVYILVDRRKDWFKIPFFKSCEAPENYKDFLIEFSRLISIVEVLKLNQNTGM